MAEQGPQVNGALLAVADGEQRYVVHLEARHTNYRRKSWDRLFESGVIHPP